MRIKSGQISFSDIPRSKFIFSDIIRAWWEKDYIELTFRDGSKFYLNYASNERAKTDYLYLLRRLNERYNRFDTL